MQIIKKDKSNNLTFICKIIFTAFYVKRILQLQLTWSEHKPQIGGGGGEGNSIIFHQSFFTHAPCQYDVT